MSGRRARPSIARAALCLSALLAACSDGTPPPRPQGVAAAPTAPSANGAAVPTSRAATAAPPAADRKAATAAPRPHPFLPVVSASELRRGPGTQVGVLTLKAIFTGPARSAIIREGNTDHLVHVGDRLGGITVLKIADDEVVVGSEKRKQVLSLYRR